MPNPPLLANKRSLGQVRNQRFGSLQICRVQAFCEPIIEGHEQVFRFSTFASIGPEPGETGCRTQLQGFGRVVPRDGQGRLIASLSELRVTGGGGQQLALQPVKPGQIQLLAVAVGEIDGEIDTGDRLARSSEAGVSSCERLVEDRQHQNPGVVLPPVQASRQCFEIFAAAAILDGQAGLLRGHECGPGGKAPGLRQRLILPNAFVQCQLVVAVQRAVMECRLEPSEGLRGRVAQLLRQGDPSFQRLPGLIREALMQEHVRQIGMQGDTGIVSDLMNGLLLQARIVASEAFLQMLAGLCQTPHMQQGRTRNAMAGKGRYLRTVLISKAHQVARVTNRLGEVAPEQVDRVFSDTDRAAVGGSPQALVQLTCPDDGLDRLLVDPSLEGAQATAECHEEIELQAPSSRSGIDRSDKFQTVFQLRDSLAVGGPAGRAVACDEPSLARRQGVAGHGVVIGQQLRLGLGRFGKDCLEGFDDLAVKGLAPGLQEAFISGIADQRMFEGVARLGRSPALEDKLGLGEFLQAGLQIRFGAPGDGRQERIVESCGR